MRIRLPFPRKRKNDWIQGMVAGAVGGLAASYAMTLFLRLLDTLGLDPAEHHPQYSVDRGDRESAHEEHEGTQDDATVEAAERVAGWFGVKLSARQKEIAGPLM